MVGDFFDAYSSRIDISGGTLSNIVASLGTELNISNGSTIAIDVFSSVVNISDGTTGAVRVYSGSVANIDGGNIGNFSRAFTGSVVNISGGTLGEFEASANSEVNIFGSEFFLGGVPLDGLVIGEAFTIVGRDSVLSGRLTSGEEFSFGTDNLCQAELDDFFDPDGTLTVTLTAPFLLGDVNQDDVVDFSDIAPFIEVLSNQTFQAEADTDGNEVVDFFDIPPFINILIGQ